MFKWMEMELLPVGWCVMYLMVNVECLREHHGTFEGLMDDSSRRGYPVDWRSSADEFSKEEETKHLHQQHDSQTADDQFDHRLDTDYTVPFKTASLRFKFWNNHKSNWKSYSSDYVPKYSANLSFRNLSPKLLPGYHNLSSHQSPRDFKAVYSRVRSRRRRRSPREGTRREGDGQIQLEGGGASGTGNVLIRHNGRTWSVCDDGWTLSAAQVVCKTLGYTGALGHTTRSYFGRPHHDIGLDNVQCLGDEESIFDCRHEPFGIHNCNKGEAAGVFCAPSLLSATRPPQTSTAPPSRTARATSTPRDEVVVLDDVMLQDNEVYQEAAHLNPRTGLHRHKPNNYSVKFVNGRNSKEGRVEILLDGERGVICSDHWTLLEARVACRQAGLGLAQSALQANFFGGERELKLAGGVRCEGEEEALSECYHDMSGRGTTCSRDVMVAGVVCTHALPDLVPNATLLATSAYLHDQPLYFMQCAMEENCAASSAFDIKRTRRDWHVFRRRLLRFSSSVWNFGTADFRPGLRKEDWEWHLCHMHYHSMQIFAHYDVLDSAGNRLAEGHKASFCLEDVQCLPNVKKKYACKGFGDQGISIGCADDYLHDIDCQWIDITDVKPGQYIFKVSINPNYEVAELRYDNNAVTCDMLYSGVHVKLSNCHLGRA